MLMMIEGVPVDNVTLRLKWWSVNQEGKKICSASGFELCSCLWSRNGLTTQPDLLDPSPLAYRAFRGSINHHSSRREHRSPIGTRKSESVLFLGFPVIFIRLGARADENTKILRISGNLFWKYARKTAPHFPPSETARSSAFPQQKKNIFPSRVGQLTSVCLCLCVCVCVCVPIYKELNYNRPY